METKILKQKMMELWKNTFHDSDKYISIIFDNYFNIDNIEYIEDNGILMSALLGIPYEFSNGVSTLKALYLCGLATSNEYRNKGIMSNLIERINKRAKDNGYAFTFLIPASETLKIYYSNRGYYNAMYIIENRYTSIHNFHNEYISSLSKDDTRIKRIKINYYEKIFTESLSNPGKDIINLISDYIIRKEQSVTNYTCLLHSKKDCIAIINENLSSGGNIILCKSDNNNITGVLFAVCNNNRIEVKKIYFDNSCTFYKLLGHIKEMYPQLPMSVMMFPEEMEQETLFTTKNTKAYYNYPSGNSYGVIEEEHNKRVQAKTYGMARITNCREVLKFITDGRNDEKFSILMNDPNSGHSLIKCPATDSDTSIKQIYSSLAEFPKNENTVLSLNEFSDIIFRRKDYSSIIKEAIGIPRIACNIALMLD